MGNAVLLCIFLKESVGNLMRLLFDLRWLLFSNNSKVLLNCADKGR